MFDEAVKMEVSDIANLNHPFPAAEMLAVPETVFVTDPAVTSNVAVQITALLDVNWTKLRPKGFT
jgi:hypothetical protein